MRVSYDLWSLTAWTGVVGTVHQMFVFVITTSVMLDLFDFLADRVKLTIDPGGRLV